MIRKIAASLAFSAATLAAEVMQLGPAQGNYSGQFYMPSQVQSYTDGRLLMEYQNQFSPNLVYAPLLDTTYVPYQPTYQPVVPPPAVTPVTPLVPVVVPVIDPPAPPVHSDVPEPSTFVLMLGGLAVAYWRHRR